MSDLDLDELRSELNEYAKPEKRGGRSARAERIIAGFGEIQRFMEENGRPPQHGEGRTIYERMYAVRLDRLRSTEEFRMLLEPLDHHALLSVATSADILQPESMGDDELLAELEGAAGSPDITQLRHVRTTADKRAADEIANREPCPDFDTFKPLFAATQSDLDSGARATRPLLKADITAGQFFILGGQVAYVADVGETIKAPNGQSDARLRVIYSNGTESNMLRRSLQRALYKDETGRRITERASGPLFASENDESDFASGTIYVLRSKSEHPSVLANREVLHKIGVTGGDVSRRIAGAKLDPTFLMADVELVASYDLYNINRSRLENIIHRVFGPARLDIEVKDRFGNPIVPREWFLAPIFVIDEAVERIRDGTITSYVYDPTKAALTRDD
jgi:hypothetical protein